MTAEDVQDYARGVLSSRLFGGDLEELLLQDDRARQLVRALALEVACKDLPQRTIRNLEEAWRLCLAQIAIYRALRTESLAPTVRQFAGLQLSCLEEVATEMGGSGLGAAALPPAGRQRPTAAKSSSWALLKRAAGNEKRLAKTLCAAYRSAAAPYWKARIAAWIALIEDLRFEVVWLDLVFTAKRRR